MPLRFISRVGVAIALGGSRSPAYPQASLPTVVFVCEHGTVKSLVALQHFQRLAAERGLTVRAVSRGTHPDLTVPEVVRRGLRGDGFDVESFHPQQFAGADLQSAVLIVALDAEVESVVNGRIPIVRWDSLPAVTQDYGGARTAIVARLRELIDQLASKKKTVPPAFR